MQVSRMTVSPVHPAIAAKVAGSRRQWPAVRATRPPAANCQARVGSEKNAKDGTTYVAASDSANDTTAITARTARYGRCDDGASVLLRRRTRRISQAVPMIMGGHTK